MVSHVVLQLSSATHGASGLGFDIPRREHGAIENRSSNLGRVVRVSITANSYMWLVSKCGQHTMEIRRACGFLKHTDLRTYI